MAPTTTTTETSGRVFTSVDKTKLQEAFGLAHHGSEADEMTPEAARRRFRRIARLIWDAHGEAGTPQAKAGARVLEQLGVQA